MALGKLRRWMLEKKPNIKGETVDKLKVDIKKIAIIGEVASNEDIEQIKHFAKHEEKEGKYLSILLFSTNKQLDDDSLVLQKEIKWTGEPTCQRTVDFIEGDYDLLYCCSSSMSLTLEYIIKSTKAKFKIGPHTTAFLPYLDLFLDTPNCSSGKMLAELKKLHISLIS